MYHKVDRAPETPWWVSAATFYRQMCELRAWEVVHLDDYDPGNPKHAVITFDGVYENVYRFGFPILRAFGYPFELFVISDAVGGNNEFDESEPPCRFANEAQLAEMVAGGGRIQFHTRSHRRLDQSLSDAERADELSVPDRLRALDPSGLRWFAYPHGDFSDEVLSQVQSRFCGAVTCVQGTATDRYRLNRLTVEESTRLAARTIGVLVPSYNYGDFLVEAVESVLRQTLPVDRIVIADDASSDRTPELGRSFAEMVPEIITFERNETNLGIVQNFDKGVRLLGTDYVCVLGADNRLPSHYVSACAAVLDANSRCGVAYTDLALFGARAGSVYGAFPEDWQAGRTGDVYWNITFPAFEQKDAEAQIETRNFIHGSSMYRREAYDAVGGYRSESEVPEDYLLFARVLRAGWHSGKAATFLEYRQHSPDQANTRLDLQHRLAFAERIVLEQRARIAGLEQEVRASDPLRVMARRAKSVGSAVRGDGLRKTALRIGGRLRDLLRS